MQKEMLVIIKLKNHVYILKVNYKKGKYKRLSKEFVVNCNDLNRFITIEKV